MRYRLGKLLSRITLLYVALAVVNVSAFVLLVFENQLGLISENTLLQGKLAGYTVRSQMERSGAPTLQGAVLETAPGLGASRIDVFEEVGELVASWPDYKRASATREEIRAIERALTRGAFQGRMFEPRVDMAAREISLYIPFLFQDTDYVAIVVLPMADLDRNMWALYRQCLLVAGFLALTHTAFALFVGRQMFAPLRRLLTATRAMASGRLDVSLPLGRNDEIGELAQAFNEASQAVARMQDEARDANPLTGLPGNNAIARVIDKRLGNGRALAVLHCDLDHFKAYNDAYGISRGDDVIRFTRDCLVQSAGDGGGDTFVGHEGGDDFVAVCDVSQWEPLARRIIERFDGGIPSFYTPEDAAKSCIDSVDRRGNPERFPLMSISIAVATNENRAYRHHSEIGSVLSEVKKVAKARPGSAFAVDRRG